MIQYNGCLAGGEMIDHNKMCQFQYWHCCKYLMREMRASVAPKSSAATLKGKVPGCIEVVCRLQYLRHHGLCLQGEEMPSENVLQACVGKLSIGLLKCIMESICNPMGVFRLFI